MISSLITKNVKVNGRRTSVRLEPQLWRALEDIASFEEKRIDEICNQVNARRMNKGGFTSALRVHIISYFRDRVYQTGYAKSDMQHASGL